MNFSMKQILYVLVALILLPNAAHAVILKNRDTVTYNVRVINGGEEQVITLAPSEIFRTHGPSIWFGLENTPPKHITNNGQYLIWDGEIVLQRRSDPSNSF